ncbi:MAG TPA: hypothetical protein VJJ83_03000 [Candidatus Babeliales bacterium]|nr:hypothetical protein [Candidatus Babeliales bacterium]
MLFNLTLVVQMLNFWLAYQLLARGLLPLALKLLEKQEQYAADLAAKETQKQLALAELAQQRLALAQQARALFQPWLVQLATSGLQHYPALPVSAMPMMPAAQLQTVQADLQRLLCERLQHV